MANSQPSNVSVTTSWVALPSLQASEVGILNNTGANLLVSRTADTADATKANTLKDGQSAVYVVVNNQAEISIMASSGAPGVQIISLNE